MTREEAIKQLEEVLNDNESDDGVILGNKDIKAIGMAIKALEQTPVIHCRDCEHWKHNDNFVQGKCKVTKLYPKRDWFCGSGEPRREGEQ